MKKKTWFLRSFTYFFQKLVRKMPPFKLSHRLISMGDIALITKKTNRSFAFYLFLNLTSFEEGINISYRAI